MLRWTFPAIALLLLAACDQNGAGRTAITNRCVSGGEAPEICKCMADASSRKLDADLFNVVVLGAQGEDAQTEKLVKDLPPESQARFSSTMREIIEACGAEGYVAAN